MVCRHGDIVSICIEGLLACLQKSGTKAIGKIAWPAVVRVSEGG